MSEAMREIRTHRVEGVEYTADSVEHLREGVLIPLRNGALEVQNFQAAVALSHVIAHMAEYKEILEALE